MDKAKNGDTVKVHYKGFLNDGTVFDSSEGRDPLSFTIGGQQMIPGFEQAVLGMGIGESKSVQIASEDAYGPRRDELTLTVSRDELPDHIDFNEGQRLQMQQDNGQHVVVTVTNLSDTEVTLDANHELAGMDLNFEIRLVEIG